MAFSPVLSPGKMKCVKEGCLDLKESQSYKNQWLLICDVADLESIIQEPVRKERERAVFRRPIRCLF